MSQEIQQLRRWNPWHALSFIVVFLLLGGGQSSQGLPDLSSTQILLNQAQVDGQGVYLDQLVATNSDLPAPHVRVADAPAFGRVAVWTRSQVRTLVTSIAPDIATNLTAGAERIRIARRARVLDESELKTMLTSALQRQSVRDRGELELRLGRPWPPLTVPDETLELKILDVPTGSLPVNFITRFELRTPKETLGAWQMPCQARVWAEFYVATTSLQRGQLLGKNDVVRERGDLLANKDVLTVLPEGFGGLELVENINAGSPLSQHSLRLRPVVHRGDLVEALLQDGPMTISLKVEVLEEGACGQAVRARNPLTKREIRGKVQNEQTILVSL